MLGYVWDIPFGSSLTGFTGALLKGWQLSGIGIFNSGSPIFINQDGDTLNVDSEEIRPNLVAGQDPTLPGSERTISRWFNTAAFARATATYGTSPRNPVVGPGRKVVDLSLAKAFDVRGGRQIPVQGRGVQRVQLGELEQPERNAGQLQLRDHQQRRGRARDAALAEVHVLERLRLRPGECYTLRSLVLM